MSTATKESVGKIVDLITSTVDYLARVKIIAAPQLAEMMCLHLNNSLATLCRLIESNGALRETECGKCRRLITPLQDCFNLMSNQCKLSDNSRLLEIIVAGRVECGRLEVVTAFSKGEIRDINIATRLIAGAVDPMFRLLSHLEDRQFNDKTVQSNIISPIVASLTSVLWSYKLIVKSLESKEEFYTPIQKTHIQAFIDAAVSYQEKLHSKDHINLRERFLSIEGLLVEIRSLEPK